MADDRTPARQPSRRSRRCWAMQTMTEPYTPTPEEAREQYVMTQVSPMAHVQRIEELEAAFDRMLDAVRAEAWDEGRRGAIADHQPPLSGFAHRENPYQGSEPSGKNGGERAGRVGREPLAFAPVTPPAEEWEDPEPARALGTFAMNGTRGLAVLASMYPDLWILDPRTREQYDAEEASK